MLHDEKMPDAGDDRIRLAKVRLSRTKNRLGNAAEKKQTALLSPRPELPFRSACAKEITRLRRERDLAVRLKKALAFFARESR